uniref:replication initiation protein n=1 Tax=uncultured Corynebacterium sp. TaxID=159447 RepID=UPI002597240C
MSITQTRQTALATRLHSAPAGEDDRDFLREHLQRDALHGSFTRDFSTAYKRAEDDGPAIAVLHRFGSSTLKQCEYVALTATNFRAVLVVDLDQEGTPGGWVESLHPDVDQRLGALAAAGFAPAWIGVNPRSGKAQAIWHIDPVYSAAGARSSNIELYDITARELDVFLGGDGNFARHFSRSPFYEGTNPGAYRWHCYHHEVHRLRSLLDALRALSG